MSLALLAFAFGLGVLLGGPGLVVLRRVWPGRDPSTMRLRAALIAPLVIVGLCLVAALTAVADGWGPNDDLVLATLATIAITGGGLALAGGLIGAAMMDRRRGR